MSCHKHHSILLILVLNLPPSTLCWLAQKSPYYGNYHNANINNPSIVPCTGKISLANSCDTSFFGGNLVKIRMEGDENGDDDSNVSTFVAKQSVPTFKAIPQNKDTSHHKFKSATISPKRLGLEGLVPGAFIVENAIPLEACEEMIKTCEELKFGSFNAGKNHHGALQILVTEEASDEIMKAISRYIDKDSSIILSKEEDKYVNDNEISFAIAGVNRRWRVYRYQPGGEENFAPHIDAGFPPSGISDDGQTLLWDIISKNPTSSDEKIVSRLTILMYLNEDFEGGHTVFYTPVAQQPANGNNPQILAAVKPRAGSILIFPQAVGEDAVEYARVHWPLHEGSPVLSGSQRPKYVIRSDVLFAEARQVPEEEQNDPIFRYDKAVRNTMLPKSPIFNPLFLSQISNAYNPHMGVENLGPLLYSFLRFTKMRRVVEIGAGYTSLWILQALKDNDEELEKIRTLHVQNACRLMDIQWSVPHIIENYDNIPASLTCIDNCLHQRQTASSTQSIAKTLSLKDPYFKFIQGDAFQTNELFERNSIDVLWCDFGVGSKMKEFISNMWECIHPGGFFICHSTITNRRTREWLDAIRARKGRDFTGIDSDDYVELSFLEPHKFFQNSVTILQKRKVNSSSGSENEKDVFEEPIYSEYA